MSPPQPHLNPNLALHLTDRGLTPLITTSSSANPAAASSSSARPASSTSSNVSSSRPSTASDAFAHNGPAQLQSHALTSLTSASIFAYDSASRLGYGLPQRIIVSTKGNGPMVLSSFLNPAGAARHARVSAGPPGQDGYGSVNTRAVLASAREALRPVSSAGVPGLNAGDEGEQGPLANGMDSRHVVHEHESGDVGDHGGDPEGVPGEETQLAQYQAPMLVSTVVARGVEDASDARKAATRLERIGRDFQRHWIAERDLELRRERERGAEGS